MGTESTNRSHSIAAARETLRDLINGYVRTQILRHAARLRLADLLAEAPLTVDELVTQTNADPGVLKRLLNGLAATGIVAARDDGRYQLTEVGEGMRDDVPGSLASFAILSGEEYYRAWLGLDVTARDDSTPFERALGAPLFDWLTEHPEAGERFHQRMATRIAAYAPAVARALDLSGARRIVDIGGGHGVLLEACLRQWPAARGVLFDLPDAASGGEQRLAEAGLADRVEVVGGDFFQEVTAGGDVYLLSQVLHDWDDERCRVILQNIRRAMAADGRLLVIEILMPERVTGPSWPVDMDLLMLVLAGGQERTEAQYRQLLAGARFTLERIHPVAAPGDMAVLEARPA